MSNKTTWKIFVLDGRYVIDAKINFANRTVECRMITSTFGPVPFFSETFEMPIDYLSAIIKEAQNFIPQFNKMEKEYLCKKNAELIWTQKFRQNNN